METLISLLNRILSKLYVPCRVPADKQMHTISGAILGLMLYPVIGIDLGLQTIIVIALGKEVYDYYNRDIHTPDIWDAVATVIGGIVMAFIFSFIG